MFCMSGMRLPVPKFHCRRFAGKTEHSRSKAALAKTIGEQDRQTPSDEEVKAANDGH